MNNGGDINDLQEGFGLPRGYFDGSAGRLKNAIECADELKTFGRLAQLKGNNPFDVPAGYFSEPMEAELVSRLPFADHGFTVPAGFFDEQHARLAVEARLATTIARPGSGGGFDVPRGYFESGAGKLASGRRPRARIIPLFRRRSLAAWSVAAMLLVTAGLWIYRSYVLPGESCPSFICLKESDVLGSGVMENLSEEDLMQLIDEDELRRELFDDGLPVPARDSGSAADDDYGI